jgi:hypothetical protein
MGEKLYPKETVSILELTVSHMWSIAGLVEVLERKRSPDQTRDSGRDHYITTSDADGGASEPSAGRHP